ncbi:MAG: hypothetical protein JST16_15185 [Bdellovibrionales bacterium]|nr:hypothetical protein [Bdellovibrionales bacterium]
MTSLTEGGDAALDLASTSPLQDLICLFTAPRRFFAYFRHEQRFPTWVLFKAWVGFFLFVWLKSYVSAPESSLIPGLARQLFEVIQSSPLVAMFLPDTDSEQLRRGMMGFAGAVTQGLVLWAPAFGILGLVFESWTTWFFMPWVRIARGHRAFTRLFVLGLYLAWYGALAAIPHLGSTLASVAIFVMGLVAVAEAWRTSFWRAFAAVYLMNWVLVILMLIMFFGAFFAVSARAETPVASGTLVHESSEASDTPSRPFSPESFILDDEEGAVDIDSSPSLRSKTPRPADWILHTLPMTDSRSVDGRPRLKGKDKDKPCLLEIVELKYRNNDQPKPRGTVLLIPGLNQNGFVFDLDPERGISYARQIMEQGLQVYFLHPRGVGRSCYPPKSDLVETAISDVTSGIKFVAGRAKEKITVIGHSEGGIVLEASLAGADRDSNGKTYFNSQKAAERQSYVKSIGVIGANVAMTTREKITQLKVASYVDAVTRPIVSKFVDYVPAGALARTATKVFMPIRKVSEPILKGQSPAYWGLYKYLYNVKNVDERTRQAFINKALDGSSVAVLQQYAEGIRKGGLRTSSGEKFADNLKNITVPVAQVVFENDAFSEIQPTKNDSYNKLGSEQTAFFIYPGQGHEDFMMNARLGEKFRSHTDWLFTHGDSGPLP